MQKKRISAWTALVVIIVLLSLIVVYFQSNDVLDAPTSNVITKPDFSAEDSKIELSFFSDDENHYSIGIPVDWKRVTKDGFNTFIHSPSATSVQVQTFPYSPDLLSVSKESVEAELSKSGFSLASFSWYDATSYSIVYEKITNEESYVYAEITFFDRSDAIRLVFTINGTYANKAIDYITVITDNFKWQRQDPFPEGMLPYYSSYGKYEFVYPAEWNTGISNNVYLIQDPSSGSAISVMANESSVTYEKFSKLDYANYAANGRSSYVLQHFSSDNNVIYAEGSYMSGNTNMILVQYLIATGKYEYAITFEVPKSHFEEQAELMQKIINTFRIYT